MDAFTSYFPDLLVAAALLAAAIALAPILELLRLPGPAAFLAVGVIAGISGYDVAGTLSPLHLQEIGVIALYAILFQGGLATGFQAWRFSARPILLLGLPGTAATAGGLAVFGHYVLGFEWHLALLIGIALAPTDPAAVYATLRGAGGRTRARTVLEGESGFNDPVGISLMVVAVAALSTEGSSTGETVIRLVEELGIGLAGGLVGAGALVAALRATPRLEEGLQAIAMLVGAVIVGAGTASLHGSGFLAVYLTGLLLADRWAKQDGRHHAVPESVAAAAEPILFGLLGAAFAPLVGATELWQGIVVTLATVFLARPLVSVVCLAGSGLSREERTLVSWGGLKGAVPLLLAAYPALELLPETARVEAIVLVATATSIVVQGATLRGVAGRIRPAVEPAGA